jgi:tRNA G46 methylase TrmB
MANFSDPQPKRSKVNKRLTSSMYLDIYKKIAIPNACVHLKTDNQDTIRLYIGSYLINCNFSY